ncbi:DNA damage response protein Rtt109, putative [Paecilomyces variotii No. 5]|uniref:histone acetyltransferase n=1 Tax=Byssochlamys spectabilis (strain No. 5 / NBRC 109023) TaxID=1356009 RepID=V5HR90_BYSSN|nr:DNA damage response protein Rtt109, putative [Paecilomyces variotii No. 5]
MSKLELGDLLAEILPKDVGITVRHVSTTPTQCDAIFSAPPGEEPEVTYCESHFLAVTIKSDENEGHDVLVFGMEVLVYSTDRLTTLFVSKADSTGYLHLLKAPPKLSLLRTISTTFLSYLVKTRQRPGIRLVLSLFARAQNQYLFPGSIDNSGKHVLDDRGLIKWWCRAFDPILREHEPESSSKDKAILDQTVESAKSSATAYLIVPGCDKFETRAFFPATAKTDDPNRPRWVNSYPLHQICMNPEAPPRCLVPRFPDDPKARFLTDLDDELPQPTEGGIPSENAGQWRSVKSLSQFWEMMAFRQECSAGRLVGFLWLVVNPPGLINSDDMAGHQTRTSTDGALSSTTLSTKEVTETKETYEVPLSLSDSSAAADGTTENPVPPEVNEDKEKGSTSVPQLSSVSESISPSNGTGGTHAFHWPEAGRGHVVLSDSDYKSANDCLIEQDFETKELAVASTKTWVDKVAALADELIWGERVVGQKPIDDNSSNQSEKANLINTGLVRKRKKEDSGTTANSESAAAAAEPPGTTSQPDAPQASETVNVLNANFIRKKKKT